MCRGKGPEQGQSGNEALGKDRSWVQDLNSQNLPIQGLVEFDYKMDVCDWILKERRQIMY
jgi:hypothetical protein